MGEEVKRTLAYTCPVCRQSVVVERSAFQLTAASCELPCPCEKSSLLVDVVGEHIRLTVPCLSCGKDHVVECDTRAFLEERVLALSCGASGLDCCYIGEEGAVFAAMKRLEEAMDKLAEQPEEQGAFLDEILMHEMLSEIRDIAQRGGITCSCGGEDWGLQVNFSSIDLRCEDCGGVMRIPAATGDDLEHLCCHDKLCIHGKEVM